MRTHSFVWACRFSGSTVRACREGWKSSSERVYPGTRRNAQPVFWVAQQHSSGYPVWSDACSWRPRCRHPSGLVGWRWITAGDEHNDRNHWSVPACGQARQRRPFTSRCVRTTRKWWHCRSVLDNPEDAHKEFERYRAAQIAVDIDKDTLERLFLKGHVNKLGLIVKESPEKHKLRLVVDMRRSKANARAAVPERPILPRPRDVLADWEEFLFRGCLFGLHVRSKRFLRKCHVQLFRRILSRAGAPRRT